MVSFSYICKDKKLIFKINFKQKQNKCIKIIILARQFDDIIWKYLYHLKIAVSNIKVLDQLLPEIIKRNVYTIQINFRDFKGSFRIASTNRFSQNFPNDMIKLPPNLVTEMWPLISNRKLSHSSHEIICSFVYDIYFDRFHILKNLDRNL